MSFHDKYEARLLRALHEQNSAAASNPGPRCLICRCWSRPCPSCLGRLRVPCLHCHRLWPVRSLRTNSFERSGAMIHACPACRGRQTRILPRPESWSAQVAAAAFRHGPDLTGFALYLRRRGLVPRNAA